MIITCGEFTLIQTGTDKDAHLSNRRLLSSRIKSVFSANRSLTASITIPKTGDFMIRKFISYYKPHLKLFTLDLICAFTVAVCNLFYPVVAKNIINDYVPNRDLRLLILSGAAMLLIYCLKGGLNYFIQYWGHIVGVRIQADMRNRLFRHLQKMPFSFYDHNQTGSLMSRMVNDLQDISELAHHGPEDLLLSTLTIFGALIMMGRIDLVLAGIVAVFIPLMVLFGIKTRTDLSNAFRLMREKVAGINHTIEQSISGVRVARAYNNDAYEYEKFAASNSSYVGARGVAYRQMAIFFSGMNFLSDVLYLVTLVAGGLFCYFGRIDVGEYAAFILYTTALLNPIRTLVQSFEQLQVGMTGFERYIAILDHEPEANGTVTPDAPLKGNIRFERVTFSYQDDENLKKVVSDLSLEIRAASTVAIVGPSGAGKSTLCNLIPKFYPIDSGKITIDGYDINDLENEYLRGSIGVVAQDVFIFAGTLRDNILYGRPGATEEEVVEAAKYANLHDYILTLPDGYDTYVGERGVRLSGGQKQRISIARVFLKNPPILIFDEATSSLDNITERAIQASIEKLSRGRTSIIVAHRLSTIRNADRILVMRDQRIVEDGTHDELIRAGKYYARIYGAGEIPSV